MKPAEILPRSTAGLFLLISGTALAGVDPCKLSRQATNDANVPISVGTAEGDVLLYWDPCATVRFQRHGSDIAPTLRTELGATSWQVTHDWSGALEFEWDQFHKDYWDSSDGVGTFHEYPIFDVEVEIVARFDEAHSALLAIEDRVKAISTELGVPIEFHFDRGETTSTDDISLNLTIGTPKQDDDGWVNPGWVPWPSVDFCWNPIAGQAIDCTLERTNVGAIQSDRCSDVVPTDTPYDAIPQDLARVLRFAVEDVAPYGAVTFDFRGWGIAPGYPWGGVYPLAVRWAQDETYRLEASAKLWSAELPISSNDSTDSRQTAIESDPPSPMWPGITGPDGAITSVVGAANDAIWFLHVAEAARRFPSIAADLTMTRVNPTNTGRQETLHKATSMRITTYESPCDERSSLNVQAAGRLDEGGTAQSIVDRIGGVVHVFEARGLTPPELQSMSIAWGGTWTAALSSSGSPVSDDLEVTSGLLSELRRLGVHVEGNQKTEGFEIAFKIPPATAK